MFALEEHTAKIANVNPRAELNGNDTKLAADIKFETCIGRDLLDEFDPALRGLMFREPQTGDQPQLIDSGDGATALRMPKLQPLGWDEKYPGYSLVVHGLLDDVAIPVELSGFTFKGLDGGSVKTSFRATCHPDADQIGHLCGLIQNDVEISLVPPAKKEPDLVDAAGEGPKPILLAKIVATENKSRHLYTAIATDTNGVAYQFREAWSHRPSLDEVAVEIFKIENRPVEFTPACRDDYTGAEA